VSVAVQAVMEGVPEPRDLRVGVCDGWAVVTVGCRVVGGYRSDDVGMRNVVVVMLTELGFAGVRVAEVMGLSPVYVSTLRGRARREGSAGLVRARGRRPKLSAAQVARARAWRAEGVSDVRIAGRLRVTDKTVARALGQDTIEAAVQDELGLDAEPEPETMPEPEPEPEPGAEPDAEPEPEPEPDAEPESEPGHGAGAGAGCGGAVEAGGLAGGGSARIGVGRFGSRYAGAMLLHAFGDRVGAEGVFASAGTPMPGRRFDDVAVLSAVSVVFALGFACMEQAKHPDRAQVGPLAGVRVLPELRTLRPRLSAIADGCDPLGLQRAFAAAMLTADPCTSGVYFIDEHFVPYTGALPVGKGWNTKRRHAEAGRVDTVVADAAGRAVCFTAGEPAGLSVSLPPTLAELKHITGENTKIMLGFDRGGSYPSVFGVCRDAGVDWITYRRGKPAAPTALPVHATLTRAGKTTQICYTDERVTIKDYGTCRQITLFEGDQPALQILTSETAACPGALIWFARARWRIENLFKYLDFYGIDYLTDYTATIHTNTRPIPNPARAAARDHLTQLQAERDKHRQRIGAAHTDRTLTLPALNRELTTTQTKIHKLDKQITAATNALKTIPAKLPANLINPDATRAIHRATRRGLQMVLRLLAANAEHWLAHHLNTYLQDPDEYRTTTRNLLHLAGTITYHPTTIHVELDQPTTPRLTRALTHLLDEINTTPPHIPGDPRPITYTISQP
jgi:transposase